MYLYAFNFTSALYICSSASQNICQAFLFILYGHNPFYLYYMVTILSIYSIWSQAFLFIVYGHKPFHLPLYTVRLYLPAVQTINKS